MDDDVAERAVGDARGVEAGPDGTGDPLGVVRDVDEHLLAADAVGLHVDVDADELVLESLHSADQRLAVLLQLRLLGLIGAVDLPVDPRDLVRDALLLQVDPEDAVLAVDRDQASDAADGPRTVR